MKYDPERCSLTDSERRIAGYNVTKRDLVRVAIVEVTMWLGLLVAVLAMILVVSLYIPSCR